MTTTSELNRLRLVITENLRVQRGGVEHIPHIEVTSTLTEVKARQNHAIYAHWGCGKLFCYTILKKK
jgi:hypothetical protein